MPFIPGMNPGIMPGIMPGPLCAMMLVAVKRVPGDAWGRRHARGQGAFRAAGACHG